VKLGRTLPIIALVYVIEGFPMGIHGIWDLYLREQGASLTDIGRLLSILGLAWSFKVIWSPLVDRWGNHRQWIAGSMVTMALALLCIASTDADQIGVLLCIAFGVFCLASATQDIAIDGYSIGITNRGDEGPVTSLKAVGYRAGMLIASAVLLLPRWIGWQGTFVVAAILSTVMAASVYATPIVKSPAEAKPKNVETAKQALWPAMNRWFYAGHNGIATLAFVMLFRVGDLAMNPMLDTFWQDSGFTLEEIGLVSKGLGVGAFMLGAVGGGWVVHKMGILRALWILGGLALLSNVAYAAVAAFPEVGRPGVYAAGLIEAATGGLVATAFMAYLMRICEQEHAVVQYALLTAAYRSLNFPVTFFSGQLTDQMGYAAYFALTALFALPAFLFLPRAAKRIEENLNDTPIV
jgi:PAT family beta-lactamase induction signal transducer AmpG